MMQQRGGRKENPNKITGLFQSRNKRGLFVGTADEKYLGNLIRIIKDAKADRKGVTFFLWKSDFEDGPAYNLTADVAQDRPRGGGRGRSREDEDDARPRRRPIEADDERDAPVGKGKEDEEEDLPF